MLNVMKSILVDVAIRIPMEIYKVVIIVANYTDHCP